MMNKKERLKMEELEERVKELERKLKYYEKSLHNTELNLADVNHIIESYNSVRVIREKCEESNREWFEKWKDICDKYF